MRINGRTLRASTLVERRLLLAIGTDALHIPRRENPFRVARKLEQLARKLDEDISSLRLRTRCKPREPQPSPGADLPFPAEEHPVEEQDDLCA